jgi:heptosyltransferase-2
MERVLVVKLASLGDLLTITPALRALRASFPAAYVGVLATPSTAPLLKGLDSVDACILFDKAAFDRPLDAVWRAPTAIQLGRGLRRGRWDTLVLLHHLTTRFGIAKYAALARASGASVRVGLDNGRGRGFLSRAAEDRGFGWRHEADYWLDVVAQLGAHHPGDPRLELVVAKDDEHWAAARWQELGLRADAPAVLLAPGSGAFSRARRWAPERFVRVGRELMASRGLQPLVLAGVDPDEQRLARQVAVALGESVPIVPTAPTPQALAALIRRCRLLVANDSGPVHLAAAVETPVVSIFGPINLDAWRPYPPRVARNQVAHEPLACSPCIYRGHDFGTPAGCPARTCLAILEPSTVVAAAERALAGAVA